VGRTHGIADTKGLSELVANPFQYVRTTTAAPVASVSVGNVRDVPSSPEAIRARYEQKISGWLQRHKVYPKEAKELKQEGKPVLRVRLDRGGQVTFFAIEKSTGFQILDRAALDMVNRANPFPAPPPDYPGNGVLEFLIPVQFKLN
jgi:TonB family C-terminal domain